MYSHFAKNKLEKYSKSKNKLSTIEIIVNILKETSLQFKKTVVIPTLRHRNDDLKQKINITTYNYI